MYLEVNARLTKGAWRDFRPPFFHYSNPSGPLINLLKHFCNRLVSISPRYLILKFKFLTKTIYLKNFWVRNCILKIIKICSPMMDVFTHRRILYLVVPLRASIPTLRCGFWLRGLHFDFCGVHFDSAVYVHETTESASDVPHSHRGVCLWCTTFTPRSQTLVSHCGVSKKMNISKYNKTELKNTLICLSGGQMGSKMWLKI